MDIRDWPFEGKRKTNDYVHALAAAVWVVVYFWLLFMWFMPVIGFTFLYLFFRLCRHIYRDIRMEWK